MTILLYGIKTSNEIKKLVKKTILILIKKGISVGIDKFFFNNLNLEISKSIKNLNIYHFYEHNFISYDLVLTFGGDGTVLSLLPLVSKQSIPIVSVNTGRLGFLTSISKDEFFTYLDEYLNNNYLISKRNLLKINSKLKITFPYALNEITICRKKTNSMITIESKIDNKYLNTFWGDGLIISTPTGSTGYNLSCGGPIISPDNQVFILTPIAGHNLNIRPLVISNTAHLSFKVTSRSSEYSLSLDSRLYSIPIKTEIKIEKAPFSIKLALSHKYCYYKTLRNKLYWGSDSRN